MGEEEYNIVSDNENIADIKYRWTVETNTLHSRRALLYIYVNGVLHELYFAIDKVLKGLKFIR